MVGLKSDFKKNIKSIRVIIGEVNLETNSLKAPTRTLTLCDCSVDEVHDMIIKAVNKK